MPKSIPKTLQGHDDHAEWFAKVMTAVRNYGDSRAESAIIAGTKDTNLQAFPPEKAEACINILMDGCRHLAELRDLIGGTVIFGGKPIS